MKRLISYLVWVLAAGCGPGVSTHPGTDGPMPDGPPDGPPAETRRLGMNDISMLMPLPVGVGAGSAAMPADGGVYVEQRPVGIEDESARHGGLRVAKRCGLKGRAGSAGSETIALECRRRGQR